MNQQAILITLGLFLGFGVPTLTAAPEDNIAKKSNQAGPQMGEDVPALKLRAYNEEVALKLVNTPDVSVHNFVGVSPEKPHSVVVLHFFSVSNQRSVDDLQMLQKLFRRYEDDGLMVISICIDSDKNEAVYDKMERAKVAFPVLNDRFGIVSSRYGLRHLPSIYVIDSEARVASVREGYSVDISDVLETEVKAELK